MSTESSILRSLPVCLLFAAASTLPADAQAPIAPGTVLLDLSADPSSQLVLSKEELEKRLCDVLPTKNVRRTKDPDPSLIIYDDSLDIPTNPPDPPPDPPPGGGLWD